MKHSMWKRRKISLIGLMFGLSLGLWPVVAQNFEGTPVTIEASGNIEASDTVPLTFGASATVSEILVEEGQFVSQGDVLARLDTVDLEIAIRNAENALNQQEIQFAQLTDPARDVDVAVAEANLGAAQASASAAYDYAASSNDVEIARLRTEQARNQLWQAQLQRDMTLSVGPEFRSSSSLSAMSQEMQINSSLDQADIGIDIAEANYSSVQQQGPNLTRLGQANASIVQSQILLDNLLSGPDALDIRLAEISIETSRLALEQVQIQLEDAVIIAPFDGIIVTNNLIIGELPPTNTSALELADTSNYLLDLTVEEVDVVYLAEGQQATITLDAVPGEEFTGTVTHIGLMPIAGEAIPSYQTRVAFDNPTDVIRIGMSGTAAIVVGSE